MTDKEYVILNMPKARCERQKTNRGDVYYLIRDGREYMYFVEGKSKKLAWKRAKERILSNIKPEDISEIKYEGIDHKDYPDYCDSYVSSGMYKGRLLVEEELEYIADKNLLPLCLNVEYHYVNV